MECVIKACMTLEKCCRKLVDQAVCFICMEVDVELRFTGSYCNGGCIIIFYPNVLFLVSETFRCLLWMKYMWNVSALQNRIIEMIYFPELPFVGVEYHKTKTLKSSQDHHHQHCWKVRSGELRLLFCTMPQLWLHSNVRMARDTSRGCSFWLCARGSLCRHYIAQALFWAHCLCHDSTLGGWFRRHSGCS